MKLHRRREEEDKASEPGTTYCNAWVEGEFGRSGYCSYPTTGGHCNLHGGRSLRGSRCVFCIESMSTGRPCGTHRDPRLGSSVLRDAPTLTVRGPLERAAESAGFSSLKALSRQPDLRISDEERSTAVDVAYAAAELGLVDPLYADRIAAEASAATTGSELLGALIELDHAPSPAHVERVRRRLSELDLAVIGPERFVDLAEQLASSSYDELARATAKIDDFARQQREIETARSSDELAEWGDDVIETALRSGRLEVNDAAQRRGALREALASGDTGSARRTLGDIVPADELAAQFARPVVSAGAPGRFPSGRPSRENDAGDLLVVDDVLEASAVPPASPTAGGRSTARRGALDVPTDGYCSKPMLVGYCGSWVGLNGGRCPTHGPRTGRAGG